MKRNLPGFLPKLVALGSLLVFCMTAFAGDKTSVQLFFTGDVYGYIKDCGCKGNPLGGLARRATYVHNAKNAEQHQILVDSGDFGSSLTEEQTRKVGYLLHGMSMLNYAAINLADKDLQYGKEFLTRLQQEYNLPFVSANVYLHGSDERFVQPYVIKEVGGTKIGIFGVTLPLFPEKMQEIGLEIKDPTEAAKAMVVELEKKCDVVVALAHLGLDGAKRLAADVPGIDFVLSGHNRSLSPRPEQVGETVVMQSGAQGKYLGQIEFDFNDGKVTLLQGKTVPLDRNIPDDEQLAKLVNEYDAGMSNGTDDTDGTDGTH